VPDREPFERVTIRAALLLGFGLIFGLWLFAGYQLTQRMAELQRQADAINARYMHAQDLVASVRAQILLGSVYVRDALLDPDPGKADSYRAELDTTLRAIDEAVRQYVPVLDSEAEREHFARLRAEIDVFRATMLDLLSPDHARRPAEARRVLQRQIVPTRESVIRLSEEVQALNRGVYVRQQSGVAEVYALTQRRVWRQLGLALAASLAIGLFAARYAGRLEAHLRRQRARDVETAHELQRLSAKLVTAQEEERRTIARELHDEVGQVLTAIKVELALAERAIDGTGAGSQALAEVRTLADGALHTVRDLSHLLHPAVLDDLGLPAAVEWALKGFSKRSGVRTELLHDGMDERLAPDTEAAAYRIVQEALTNVGKHADATLCRVFLQRLPHTVLITVEDDGKGFDAAGDKRTEGARGLGLIGIRERVAQCRGTLRLESAPGKGARMTVELPAHEAAPAVEVETPFPDPPALQHTREALGG
jgi:signal transduction histidine kinase